MKNHYNSGVAVCMVILIKESGKGLLVESGIHFILFYFILLALP